MRIASIVLCILLAGGSVCWALERAILRDDLDGTTSGHAVGISFDVGKDGQAAVFDAQGDIIEFPASAFATQSGRIEFDLKPAQSPAAEHPHWCVFSDVASGAAYPGAVILQWRQGSELLEYGIFDGSTWHTCAAKNVSWQPGVWHHVALTYGPEGMRLEVDNQLTDSNDYSGELAASTKRFGMCDALYATPPMMIDNFRSYRRPAYDLKVSNFMVLPIKDGFLDDVTISYEVGEDCTATLDVLDKSGAVVATLVDGQKLAAGVHRLIWNGAPLPDGEYVIRLTAASSAGDKELRQTIFVEAGRQWKKPQARFRDFFPKGAYYCCESDNWYNKTHIDDPVAAQSYYDRTMKDLAEHGFNLVNPVWTPVDHRKIMLDAAHKYGLKVIVHLQEINSWIGSQDRTNVFTVAEDAVRELRHHPAVVGYYLVDEPAAREDIVARIVLAKRALETIDPAHPGFSCLIGPWEGILTAVDYQVLLIDVYPLVIGWSGDFSGYIYEIERAQRNAGERQFWMIPQVFGKPKVWKIPTVEEVRAQVWLALAYGAKGFIHFIYQSTTGFNQGEWLQGMVDMDLNQMDARLDELKHINADLDKLSPTLLSLRPTESVPAEVPDGVVIKTFTDPRQGCYVILANKDTKNPVTFAWTQAAAVDVLTGRQIGPQISLDPGAGKLLKLP